MSIEDKKTVIIEQIQNETSENILDSIINDYSNMKSWDSEFGKNVLRQLLEKSQQEILEGKSRPYEDFINEIKSKYTAKAS